MAQKPLISHTMPEFVSRDPVFLAIGVFLELVLLFFLVLPHILAGEWFLSAVYTSPWD